MLQSVLSEPYIIILFIKYNAPVVAAVTLQDMVRHKCGGDGIV